MKRRWTARARRALEEIERVIAADDALAARAWIERLRARARTAAAFPGSGRVVPELGRDDLREALMGAYRIVYRVRPEAIYVLTVFEGHRQLRDDDVGA